MYSVESFPHEGLIGKPGYTPEYAAHSGVQLTVKGGEWSELPNRWTNVTHRDWMDKRGTRENILAEDITKAITSRFASRGFVILDHEPSAKEKEKIEKEAAEANLAHRMKAVEWYENQVREKEVTGHGRTHPTPYEDECYTILGLTKPYSVEAMRAQRHPGEAVGEQIVAALDRLDKRRRDEAAKPAPTK
jgi:hypothetical protein